MEEEMKLVRECSNCKNFCRYYIKRPYGYNETTNGFCKIRKTKVLKLCDKYEECSQTKRIIFE